MTAYRSRKEKYDRSTRREKVHEKKRTRMWRDAQSASPDLSAATAKATTTNHNRGHDHCRRLIWRL